MRKEYGPIEHPKLYRKEFLKTIVFFLTIMPLIDRGLVNLVPDPGSFDPHWQEQTLDMAKARASGIKINARHDDRLNELMRRDLQRSLMSLPKDALRRQVLNASPVGEPENMDDVMRAAEHLKEDDPLAVLQDGSLAGGK